MVRSSGILLHPTSLPSPFGIGNLGPEAFKFVDFLIAAGQTLGKCCRWDRPATATCLTLPTPPSRATRCWLVDDGLLDHGDLEETPVGPIDYGYAHQFKGKILARAYQNFPRTDLRASFETFVQDQRYRLDHYALFRALKDEHGGVAWTEWVRDAGARERLKSQIEAHQFYQFLFFRQWSALRNYCRDRGIRIIGDFPIFVAHDSADVWSNPELFKLDHDGKPIVVAGVPPDYFSATGQFWGNPLYNWDRMRADGFTWWIERVRALFALVDIARVDHFRGFVVRLIGILSAPCGPRSLIAQLHRFRMCWVWTVSRA